MKTLLCSLLLLLGLSAGAQNTNCNLMVWTPSPTATGSPGEIYKFYTTTNLTDPNIDPSGWTVIATCPTTTTNVPIAVLPGIHYFCVTFSNWWGESIFSNVASTPAAPLPPTLRIERIGP